MHTTKRTPARNPTTSRTTDAYREAGVEPTLSEMLADPIVRILMAHDSVSNEMVLDVLASARERTFEAA